MNFSSKYIFDGHFGIERETLRVTSDGKMAKTPHPFPDSAIFTRDFCENQLELVTPVCDSIEALTSTIKKLDKEIRTVLAKNGEYMWMCSNPPHMGSESDIPIALFDGVMAFKHDYRLKLERRYGKRLMAYSGIHFNFSFSDVLINELCGGEDVTGFMNNLYFRLAKQVLRHSWLIVLLTAASPVYDKSFDNDGDSGSAFDGYASKRSGSQGYWNQFNPILDYSDLSSYIRSIEDYINKGALFSIGELYLPVRLKPRGSNSPDELENTGINHIELRMLDLNPLSPIGIEPMDLEFIHYFLLYLADLPDFEFTPELQLKAIENHKAASAFDIDKIKIDDIGAVDAAKKVLEKMEKRFALFPKVIKTIKNQRAKLSPGGRYCEMLYKRLIDNYQHEMLKISKGNH